MAIFNGWQITRAGVVFVVGIIILIGLVFGGVWMVRERGEQARRQEAAKIAQQNLEEQSETDPSTQTGTNTGAVAVSEPTDPDTQTTTSTPPASNVLPETGADVSQIVSVTLVTLAVAYYVTSRRAAREL